MTEYSSKQRTPELNNRLDIKSHLVWLRDQLLRNREISEADALMDHVENIVNEAVLETREECGQAEAFEGKAYLVMVGKRTFDRVFSSEQRAQEYLDRFLANLPEYEGQTRILEVEIDGDDFEVVR